MSRFRKLSEGNTPAECKEIYNDFYRQGGWRGRKVHAEQRQIENVIVRPTGWQEGDRLLELGCGNGQHANILHGLGFDVTAVDHSDVGISRAKARHPGPNFVCSDVREFDPEEEFDGIYIRGLSFYHYELSGINKHGIDALEETRNMFDWLRTGGVFVMQISSNFSGDRPERWIHHNKLSDYVGLFSQCGQVISTTDWNGRKLESDAEAQKYGGGTRSGIVIMTRKR